MWYGKAAASIAHKHLLTFLATVLSATHTFHHAGAGAWWCLALQGSSGRPTAHHAGPAAVAGVAAAPLCCAGQAAAGAARMVPRRGGGLWPARGACLSSSPSRQMPLLGR